MRERLPLLITGITGVAGFNAFHFFHNLYPGHVIGLTGPGIVAQDAEDPYGMTELFRRQRFRAVLNCVGNCALKSCELDPAMARTVNVDSARIMAGLVRDHGCRLVHLSSDLVFSGGDTGNYVESDPVDPVTVYGKTMVEAEELLLKRNPECAILRISLPMGRSFNRHAGAIDWIQARFRAGRPATLYFDEVRSCTYCDDLNSAFAWFLAGTDRGIFHLGSPRPIALFEIAQVVNRVGGFDPHLLKGCPRKDAGPMPPRAGNVSMGSDKLIARMGGNPFRPWPLGDNLVPTGRMWHFLRPRDEAGSFERIEERLYQYKSEPGALATG